ncbi:MAG: methyltransferase domain-containing protein, partial [Acidobacteriota bacterium]
VHGYSDREALRLRDQADSVRDIIHGETVFPEGSLVLEAGCGVGAQTVSLAERSPGARFVSVDISPQSLETARLCVAERGLSNVRFECADLFALPFEAESFDHVFICFVLEHLKEPLKALMALRRVLKRGGTVTVVEGDHGSCYFHPRSADAQAAWNCLIDVQARLGGDSLIGRRLYPLLREAGFGNVSVSPRIVYMDASLPRVMDSFVRKTIIPMVEGVKTPAIEGGLINENAWSRGTAHLHGIADGDGGTFCYTFFKAVGVCS